ncbi:hypothetical protein ANO11243_062960 [Dothideomycetidae sp. 11243]|nr:hypothetical protein ANO11243_062960 [fungal sp. No.11243]
MLYVLSLFALEPVRAVEKYEWRPLSDLERCASGTFWKAMGDNMEIDYTKVVPKFEGDFPDGLAWLEALEQWSLHYEETRSKPCTESSDLALKHLDAVFLNLPERLKIVGRWVVAITCGERLRKAIILPQPPHVFRVVVVNLLLLRKLYLGHLALPIFIRKTYISEKPESNGRYSAKDYLSYPYYVKPTFQRRWGKRAWVTWLLGRKIPGDDGNRYIPEGYAILEVGPALPSGEDMHWTNDEVRRLENSGAGACPFSFGS